MVPQKKQVRMMTDNNSGVAYIGGARVETHSEPPSPKKQSEHDIMETAMTALEEKREGSDQTADDDRDRPLRSEADAFETLQDEKKRAHEEAEQERQNQAELEHETAEAEIRQAADWHPDDQQTLQQLQHEAQEFEQAKNQLAQAQKYATENPDKISAQQRADLQEANQRLLQRQQELQDKGAKVQEAANTKSLETERQRLFKDVPELKDPENREAFIRWAIDRGVPEDQARAETRRDVIVKVWNDYQKEQKAKAEKRRNRPRPVVIRDKDQPDAMTTDQARERLKSRGSINDAVNLLHIQRQREAESES